MIHQRSTNYFFALGALKVLLRQNHYTPQSFYGLWSFKDGSLWFWNWFLKQMESIDNRGYQTFVCLLIWETQDKHGFVSVRRDMTQEVQDSSFRRRRLFSPHLKQRKVREYKIGGFSYEGRRVKSEFSHQAGAAFIATVENSVHAT